MESKIDFTKEVLATIGTVFRKLREWKGYSLQDISHILKKEYNLDVSANMLGKFERNTTKIQMEVFLALSHYYKIQLKDIHPTFEVPIKKEEWIDLIRYSNLNPDLFWILKVLESQGLDGSFFQFVKNNIENLYQLLDKYTKEAKLIWKQSENFKFLKVASPKTEKKKLE